MQLIEGSYKQEYWVKLSNFRMYVVHEDIPEMSQQEFEENYLGSIIANAMSSATSGDEYGTLYLIQIVGGEHAGEFEVVDNYENPESWDADVYCIVALVDFEAAETTWGPS